MDNTHTIAKQLSIKELLCDDIYVIPIYQRNYAWGMGEIEQLIQDIIDYMPRGKNYSIGTLVVLQRSATEKYETIDGQQRLTTLSLLASYLNNQKDKSCDLSWYNKLTIHFDSRKNSQDALQAIFDGNSAIDGNTPQVLQILNGYKNIETILPGKLVENNIKPKGFCDFLFNNVKIFRVEVPRDTDLNHYFEIMNTRGEQLEKHEILKVRMIAALDDKESENCLRRVWQACANMEKYAQMGFSKERRGAIFGDDWNSLDADNFDFDRLREALKDIANTNDAKAMSLLDITKTDAGDNNETSADNKDDSPERFSSVINFPNFLLHALRIQTEKNIQLDDKRLLQEFDEHILNDDAKENVKKFAITLLRCKFLYDKYVIKRDRANENDAWSIKSLKYHDKNQYYAGTFVDEEDTDNLEPENNNERPKPSQKIPMLLSAFHVSAPTQSYKYWLNGALRYLYNQRSPVIAEKYLKYLENLAKSFVFDRFLSRDKPAEYFDIIYLNDGICQAQNNPLSQGEIAAKLSFDNIQHNFVFNYLDYLLWIAHYQDKSIKNYKFTFRGSIDSTKQRLMMKMSKETNKNGETGWTAEKIERHCDEMTKTLLRSLEDKSTPE